MSLASSRIGSPQVLAVEGPHLCKHTLPLHYERQWDKIDQEKPGSGAYLGRRGLAESLGVASQCVEVRRVVSGRNEWVPRKWTNDVVNIPRKYLKYCSSVWFSFLCLPMCEIGSLWSDEDMLRGLYKEAFQNKTQTDLSRFSGIFWGRLSTWEQLLKGNFTFTEM